jgi:hypothetical protein
MNLGSLPDWLAAIGTVGALFVSLGLLREDRRLRAVAQAARISVWAEWRRALEGHDTSERQYFAYINNASDAPIYVDLMQVSAEPDDAPRLLVEMGTVPAHETADYGLSDAEFPPGEDPPYLAISFLDTNRVGWSLDSRAILKRRKPDTSERE